ncbi:MAG: hypothetical protein LV479_01865 [Methylacidiphilales bacterium]|nr:hypothetical protein [Candidatus Methylacidiphilales bacterium]
MTKNFQPKILQPNGWAFLDWITGVVRINRSSSDYFSLREKTLKSDNITLKQDEALLLETVTHESFHYLQICTSAYLYNLVRRLHDALSKHLIQHPILTYENLASWQMTSLREEFQFHTSILNIAGPEGLTPLHILEAAAFYMQKRYHLRNLTPAQYQDERAGECVEYTLAYDVAVSILGENTAFTVFPLFAAMSFWTSKPVETFVGLCQRFAAVDVINRGRVDFHQLLTEVSPHVLGRPALHPPTLDIRLFDQTIRSLDALYAAHRLDLYVVMAQPHRHLDGPLVDVVSPAIIFNDKPGNILVTTPDHFWPNHPRDEKHLSGARAKLMTQVIRLFELSMQIQVA